MIKSHCEDVEAFSFRRATFVEVLKQVDNLNIKKASPVSSIPAMIIKDNVDEVAFHLLDFFNVSVEKNFFPSELKDGDVSALFENSDSFHKKNYRPIIVLPSVSKVFERFWYIKCYLLSTNFSRLTFAPIDRVTIPSMPC